MNNLISRQAAINAIITQDGVVDKSVAKRILIQLPPAVPKNGRWDVEHGVFMHDGIYGDMYHCSVCGYRVRNPEGFNYCPNCGARMEDEHE